MKHKIFYFTLIIVLSLAVVTLAAYKYRADDKVMQYAVRKLVQQNSEWLKKNIQNSETRRRFFITKHLTNNLTHRTLEGIFGEKYYKNQNYTWDTRDEIIEHVRNQLNNPDRFKRIVHLLRPVFLEEVFISESSYEWQILTNDILIYFSEGTVDKQRYSYAIDYLEVTREYSQTEFKSERREQLSNELQKKEILFDQKYPDGVGSIESAVLVCEWLNRRGTTKDMWYAALYQIDSDLQKIYSGMSLREVLETNIDYEKIVENLQKPAGPSLATRENKIPIDRAIDRYKKSVQLNPDSVKAFCKLADAYTLKYSELTSDNTKIIESRKWINLAILNAYKAKRIDSKSALPFISLTKVYIALDKMDKARNNALKALAFSPGNTEAKELLEHIKRN